MKVTYLGYDLLISCLKLLQARSHEIIKIYTIADGDAYDKNEQIKDFGVQNEISVTTERFDRRAMEEMISQGCELLLCAGYPYRIPVDERIRAVNIHPSLLPIGRGPWPMPVMILKGLRSGGVTLHKIAENFDEGEILLQREFPIAENETLISLTEKVQRMAVELLETCLQDFQRIYLEAVPQTGAAEYWADPTPAAQVIVPSMETAQIDRILRAFAGYGCYLTTGQKRIKIDLPKYRRIRLSDQNRMNEIRSRYQNSLSAYTFPCIYCWQDLCHLCIYLESGWFSVRSGEQDYYFPCGNRERTRLQIQMLLAAGKPFRLGYVTCEQKQWLEETYPMLLLKEARENFDYIVPMEQIALLSGKHFHTIRKEIHQFERSGQLEYEEITRENIRIVEQLAVAWSEQTAGQQDFADTSAEIEAVRHFTELKMQGILAKKDGIYFGFVLGKKCSDRMIDIHFAKCVDKSPGADFYCKQMFCRHFQDEYEFMNMEEDMGIEGLRIRKQMYRPSSLTKLYLAEYRG